MSPRTALISYNNALRTTVLILKDIKVPNIIDFSALFHMRSAISGRAISHQESLSPKSRCIRRECNNCYLQLDNLLSRMLRATSQPMPLCKRNYFHYYLPSRILENGNNSFLILLRNNKIRNIKVTKALFIIIFSEMKEIFNRLLRFDKPSSWIYL